MSVPRSAERKVAFVMSAAVPELGMELVTRDLLRELHRLRPISLVVGGGPTWAGEEFRQTTLGRELRGWRRLFLAPRFLRWARRNDSGVVIVVGVWAALPWLLVRPRARCIVWEHSLSREKVLSSRGLGLLAKVVPTLYRRAWRIVCVSTALAKDVADLTGHPEIEVIPNVIDVGEAASVVPARRQWPPRQLLCVGSLTDTKRQSIAIQALIGLDGATELTIVGDGPNRQELLELVASSGLEKRVRFVGHLDRQRVLELMAVADVLVHPAAGETFGMVLMEAAALNLPVIAVATPHSRDFVPRYVPGQLFDGTPAGLRDKLADPAPPASAAEIETAAAARAGDLSTAAIKSQWLELIDAAAGGSRS